jgi:hypothetical protein
MIREDYVMRLIQKVAAFVRRIVKGREDGDYEGALAEADQAYSDLLGMPPGLADRLDAATMASLLGRADRIRAGARLSWEEGHVYKAKGDPVTAFLRYRRAHELYLEARALDPQEEDDSAILELSRLVPARELDPRYRESQSAR